MFKDRDQELAQLDTLLERGASQLVVVFGRRRIGKTALLTRWTDLRPDVATTLYWVAHRTTSEILLRSFSKVFAGSLDANGAEMVFTTWEAALEGLFVAARERRTIAVIDEFPYLVRSVPECRW